ncbi:PIN domain nuclease [Candidatus Roizmanbacteria bacterium CG_4_10_14_3_um_filter_39_13]|uniref:PIN domain nuclease n=2 Tax=Candidatus Roizmaniibacteriota TaxID=1752723 RepID=A0A2M7LK23_9BACT|nr:MAG: PIN domain nuclease [Candidatus Roizmanbacteria bacterium CG03_land_8_20_14_0_80_39_12]PIX68424.1 MAG: PIN domain nuclease [Candidatus Roizmanbacteria bacterium CG_4_10_14_3_um_filter_39_13]
MYLVDSDVLINFLKGEEQAVRAIKELQSELLYISIISVGEILEGLLETKNKKKLVQFNDLLKTVVVINVDLPIIKKFASMRKSLREKGLLIDNFDLLIASSCLVHDLVIVTGNISHFKRITGLKMYS